MKYLAILKDSLYETIDFKIFYVMLALSLLLSLALGLFTFPRHKPAEALANNLEVFTVEDVETLERDWFTPHARYRFTLVTSPDQQKTLASALQRQISVYQAEELAMELAMKGRFREIENARTTLPPPPPDPKDAESWQKMIETYLGSVYGLKDQRIMSVESGRDGFPRRLQAETSINWGEIRNAHDFSVLFGAIYRTSMGSVPLGQVVFIIQSLLVGWIAGWVGIIVSIIVTAGFVPNMLRKGTIDLLLVKPIDRPVLLIYKYLGGLTFVFFNALVLVGLTWVIFGLTTDFWSPWYLASVLVLTFFFAILYSFSTFVGVITRSTLASILLTIAVWFILWLVAIAYSWMHPIEMQTVMMPFLKDMPQPVVKVVDAIHFILPKTSDLTVLNEALMLQATGSERAMRQQEQILKNFSWSETIYTSAGFIALMLSLACWRFSRRDY